MKILYSQTRMPEPEQVMTLYRSAGMPRPFDDPKRIHDMFRYSNIVITAWDGAKLAGVCRGLTDWVWCCYLSDIAVDPDYQKKGIGKRLIEMTRKTIGSQSMLLLLSVPEAMTYYPKIGFTKENRGFIINRSK